MGRAICAMSVHFGMVDGVWGMLIRMIAFKLFNGLDPP